MTVHKTEPHSEREGGNAAVFRQRLLQLAKTRRVYVQPASHFEIHQMHLMLAERTDVTIASAESACAIQDASPQSIWAMHSATELLGGIAFLPLNPLGLYHLVYGKLDLKNPPVNSVAVHNERPAILYLWALVSKGRGIIGLADIMDHLDRQRFRNVDVWTSPVTHHGQRLAERHGFARFTHQDRSFYRLRRVSTG
jgi:hypothetical protein